MSSVVRRGLARLSAISTATISILVSLASSRDIRSLQRLLEFSIALCPLRLYRGLMRLVRLATVPVADRLGI
jgi:hypothetical protein